MSYKLFHSFIILLLTLSLSFVSPSRVSATDVQQATTNLIVNGDFESGNTGFTSEYLFTPGSLDSEVYDPTLGVYDLPVNPVDSHRAAASFGDHTSGSGLMMAVNGANRSDVVVWSQTVAVAPNTTYEFSAWITSWFHESPAQLQLLINGSQVGTFTAPSTSGLWQQFGAIWNSRSSTSATIEIIDLNTELNGNDFVLDDLSLQSLACGSNLIVNKGFESGNNGFSSDYAFTLGSLGSAGVYDLLINPTNSHPSAATFGDHTSGQGVMMAVNGATANGLVAWSQTVPVTPNTDYEFSAWITSWFHQSPAQLQFLINGDQVGTFTAPSTSGLWQQFAVAWNSGSSTSVTIEILDLNRELHGNDFVLDDLSLRDVNCGTPTITPTSTSNTPVGPPTQTFTPTSTATNTPVGGPSITPGGPTNTPTNTSVSDLGQLKLCQIAGNGLPLGQIITIVAGNTSYNVPAGYCVLAGQFPQTTQVTVRENIPSGYVVSEIEVRPGARLVSQDRSSGLVVVQMGIGVTEIFFTHRVAGAPTSTPVTMTSTPRPTRTPPDCAPNCTPTPTPVPTGRFQICKEADGPGVDGLFTFRFNSKSKIVPVGACSLLSSVAEGTLTITEEARAGFVVSDIYTIPANRLVSKNINNRTVTVTILPGNASTQTVIVFVNRAVTTEAIEDSFSNSIETDQHLSRDPLDMFMQLLRNGVRG